jgi:kumamolisin
MAKALLAGSERSGFFGATVTSPAPDNDRLSVTLVIRRHDQAGFKHHIATACTAAPPAHLSREDYATRFGASEEDIAAVRAFADAEGLHVDSADACHRTVTVSGTVGQFNALFDVALQHCEQASSAVAGSAAARGTVSSSGATSRSFRGRTGSIHLPEALQDRVTAVLGLDNRPQAQAHRYLRRLPDTLLPARPPVKPALGHPQLRSYTPLELATLYDFPPGDGAGQSIGIIELGGGFNTADLNTYFASLGLNMPKVVSVSVGGAKNAPSDDPNGPDGEVMLDIEIAGAIAPQANLVVYFAPNTDAGFLSALNTAIHDTSHRPSVISLSWGGPEPRWTTQALDALDDVLQSAATIGVTVCVASGDSGSGDGVGDGADHVDFPASSPYALGCGGTRLTSSGSSITAEQVWNDGANGGAGGGGVSGHFPLPAWQNGLKVKHGNAAEVALDKRGVPDVAGNADPESGYQILVHGEQTVVGGTSAVAPLWAGLIARINGARATPLGYLNPRIYSTPGLCHDIATGNNGSFSATQGWDACTGLGSPDGKQIATLK